MCRQRRIEWRQIELIREVTPLQGFNRLWGKIFPPWLLVDSFHFPFFFLFSADSLQPAVSLRVKPRKFLIVNNPMSNRGRVWNLVYDNVDSQRLRGTQKLFFRKCGFFFDRGVVVWNARWCSFPPLKTAHLQNKKFNKHKTKKQTELIYNTLQTKLMWKVLMFVKSHEAVVPATVLILHADKNDEIKVPAWWEPLIAELPGDFLTFSENIHGLWRKIPLEINDSWPFLSRHHQQPASAYPPTISSLKKYYQRSVCSIAGSLTNDASWRCNHSFRCFILIFHSLPPYRSVRSGDLVMKCHSERFYPRQL